MEFKNCPNAMFRLVRVLSIDLQYFEGRRYMIGSNRKKCFSEKNEVEL